MASPLNISSNRVHPRRKMKPEFDAVQTWLDNVAYSHSGSPGTEAKYRYEIGLFFQFIGKTAAEILQEYEGMTDREFKRKYAQYLRGFIGHLIRQGYSTNTVTSIVSGVKSFFKYNDLTLGYVPLSRSKVVFHNRDIERQEIVEILKIARPRDRAFYAVMAQTGLRPHTICQLKLKHVQPDFDDGVIPCKIDVPEEIAKGKYRSYFTFMGPEAVKHLRDYLKTRPKLTLESYLFTQYGTEEKADKKSISHRFRDAVLKLKRKDLIDYEQTVKGKPGTIRLYSLRKFFRKFAHQAGFEFVQFWMGHIVSQGQEEHYQPRDVEFHRTLYAEKAMPFLRLETKTPSEMEKQIEDLREENIALRETVQRLEDEVNAGTLTEEEITHLKELSKMIREGKIKISV